MKGEFGKICAKSLGKMPQPAARVVNEEEKKEEKETLNFGK